MKVVYYEPFHMNITSEQLKQLVSIAPSRNYDVNYYPCQVEMKSGLVHENAYIVDYDLFVKTWLGRTPPNEENNPMYISIDAVTSIKNSPNRLPAHLANKLYDAGETGMGYSAFKIMYDNGTSLNVVTGNAVDFVPSAVGLTPNNIIDVLPHQRSKDFVEGPEFVFCLINGVD